jgi:glycosyltransferase involved in cell wall biosynthesis
VVSVVIAAHNEEALIGGCLDAVLRQQLDGNLEVVVSANGCTDRTAEVAAARGVRVVERSQPGKVGALNAGDAVVTSFPRIYLDADIVLPDGALARLVDAVQSSGALAVVPGRRIDTRGRPWGVRAYFAINERLPVFDRGLFGRGMITLSERGRGRFAEFPDLIADDLFLDSLFRDAEKMRVSEVEVVVQAPFGVRALVRRLARVRRGNAQLQRAAAAGELDVDVQPSDPWAWLRDVVLRDVRLLPAAVPYVLITVCARVLSRLDGATVWGRDASTRTASERTAP